MLFDVITADPPWSFNDKLAKMKDGIQRSAVSQYRTMTIDDIAALPVADLADPTGSLLALWVPGTLLQHGLDVVKAWGFKHKQTYVWVKTKKDAIEDARRKGHLDECTSVGMGHLFRQCHELALIGTRGKIQSKVKNRSQRSVSFDRNLGHSIKPGKLQASLERMFPDSERLELFARRQRPGWLCLGDQLPGQAGIDIDCMIDALKNMP